MAESYFSLNPFGIGIMARSHMLSDAQRREFEVLRQDSRGVVDIVTNDDLLARLQGGLTNSAGCPATRATGTTSFAAS